jgi:HAD superfamily hydrolase (TIGR01509 family)
MFYNGIVFDFNGVLWLDEALQMQVWRAYGQQMRGSPVSDDELAQYCLGVPSKTWLEYLARHALSQQVVDRITAEKEAEYRQLCLAQGEAFRLSPGAVELLDFLSARQIPRTIATSSEITNLAFFIEHLALSRWFEVGKIVFDDGTYPGKPAPDIYKRAVAALDLTPTGCVVVEDSRSGIQAAHAAGIGRVYALGPQKEHERLARLPGVDGVIESLAELPVMALFGNK